MATIPQSPEHVTPPATPPVSRQPAPARRMARRWTLALLTGAAALILAALVVVRYASGPDEEATAGDPSDRLEQSAAVAPIVQPVPDTPAPAATPVESAPIAAPVVKPRPKKAATVRPTAPRVAASAKSTAPITPTAITKVPARADAAPATGQAPLVSTEGVGPAPVTLTGCLEVSVDRDEFRLSDTDGVDAPKARSWRTGFLKKRPTPVALVEPPDPHGLQNQVGKRVAATGRLTDRELRVSAVRVVGPSCD
jgi:hypothetical protein